MGGITSISTKICSTNNDSNDKTLDNKNKQTTIKTKKKKTTQNQWNYNIEDLKNGPSNWPITLECKNGKQQSPIDLQFSRMKVVAIESDPLKFINYSELISGTFVNTGYSIQFNPAENCNSIKIHGGFLNQHYRFVQYHYHWAQKNNGSEHTFNSLHYPGELHLVHQGINDPSKLAVLGIFLSIDNSSNGDALKSEEKILSKLFESLSQVQVKSQYLQIKIPPNSAFVRYEGSLTTPPCTENVTWTIFTDPILITSYQMSLLRKVKGNTGKLISTNCRPVQNLNKRTLSLAL